MTTTTEKPSILESPIAGLIKRQLGAERYGALLEQARTSHFKFTEETLLEAAIAAGVRSFPNHAKGDDVNHGGHGEHGDAEPDPDLLARQAAMSALHFLQLAGSSGGREAMGFLRAAKKGAGEYAAAVAIAETAREDARPPVVVEGEAAR